MKLLFDVTELSYMNENSGHKAGVYYVSLNLLREFLKAEDIEISFYCDYRRYYFAKEVLKHNFNDIELLQEHSFTNRLAGKIIYFANRLPIRIRYALLIASRFYDAYFYRIKKQNFEQLKGFDAYFSPFSLPSKEIETADLKRFRMIHDTIPIMENGMPKSPKDWYYKIYNSINEKDFYLTNSETTKNDVIKYFPFVQNHIKTVYLGANKNFKKTSKMPENLKDINYVFSLCTLGKRKNLEFGIRNFFKFIEKNHIEDLKLVLGGSIWTKYKNELESVLSNFDNSKIILTGYIEESELAKYYSNALCFIYPSLYEGFGLPVLEAMQCGCPVITSNISSLPEVIGDAGIQINPKSDEEMILAYEKMYFDSNFRENCRIKGLERAKLFSWEQCAKNIIEFIKNPPCE